MARSLAALAMLLPLTSAFCPLYGPVFPPPKNLASSSVVQAALEDLSATYESAFRTGNNDIGPSDTAAVQIFSIDDSAKPLSEYYHAGTTLSNTTGVAKVDGDSIFRIASISKLITVYLLMKEVGDTYWNVPITDVIPELKGKDDWKKNEINFVKWEDVTIGALAGQIAGVTANLITIEGADPFANATVAAQFGLPPLLPSEGRACLVAVDPSVGFTCSRAEFFATLAEHQPVVRPNTLPLYSSTPFVILGYTLESINGKSFKDNLQSLVSALGLTATSVDPPDASRGVIVYDLARSDWERKSGEAAPTGGLFSSLNDLSKIGRSILNSTFLDPRTTRGWLKPASYTSDLRSAVGRPWEIYRVDTKSARGVIDIFAKGGDWGLYHTKFGLIPDYNIGFVVGIGGNGEKDWLVDQIVDIVFPALEDAARQQADAAYAGTYVATNGLDSTMTFTTEAGVPGLGVPQWISNGTDVLQALSTLAEELLTPQTFRALPTNLERQLGNGMTEIAWKAVVSNSNPYEKKSPFGACSSWFDVDGTRYGHFSLDEILFTMGPTGMATKVSPRVFKIDLERSK